jgi:nucleoid DNA-binding protein
MTMEMSEIVRRTAWQAGASDEEAERLVEAFLHELRAGIAEAGVVRLGAFGTFHGTTFTPGPALAGRTVAAQPDVAGYDEGTAPSDS